MTISPGDGGPIGVPRNSLVLGAACRTRGGSLRIAGALLAALAAGAALIALWLRLDRALPQELHVKVRRAAILYPR